ncbi:unnamed protein product [Vitrella brassicaformis CCMP3155]|uniref:C3H1-type domain-containing protein n=2 Tax=Vitrella brassicaformis TaxID=1169539 RepID=A0A0G4F6A3_VITBC|nr:unnamed protein product [Vitrella brassicaformis CCMP3155]|eukprot:CEM07641.1 unnamed protein product [Vitrella brassicaformis CCMP3155]
MFPLLTPRDWGPPGGTARSLEKEGDLPVVLWEVRVKTHHMYSRPYVPLILPDARYLREIHELHPRPVTSSFSPTTPEDRTTRPGAAIGASRGADTRSGVTGSSMANPGPGTRKKVSDSNHRFNQRFKRQFIKTSMCPFMPNCRYSDCPEQCCFAHTPDELRPSINLDKTAMCPQVKKGRECRLPSCRYAHSREELRATPYFANTAICQKWLKGTCTLGDKCRYAHGSTELKPRTAGMPKGRISKDTRVPRHELRQQQQQQEEEEEDEAGTDPQTPPEGQAQQHFQQQGQTEEQQQQEDTDDHLFRLLDNRWLPDSVLDDGPESHEPQAREGEQRGGQRDSGRPKRRNTSDTLTIDIPPINRRSKARDAPAPAAEEGTTTTKEEEEGATPASVSREADDDIADPSLQETLVRPPDGNVVIPLFPILETGPSPSSSPFMWVPPVRSPQQQSMGSSPCRMPTSPFPPQERDFTETSDLLGDLRDPPSPSRGSTASEWKNEDYLAMIESLERLTSEDDLRAAAPCQYYE